jgi:hypothetical protein
MNHLVLTATLAAFLIGCGGDPGGPATITIESPAGGSEVHELRAFTVELDNQARVSIGEDVQECEQRSEVSIEILIPILRRFGTDDSGALAVADGELARRFTLSRGNRGMPGRAGRVETTVTDWELENGGRPGAVVELAGEIDVVLDDGTRIVGAFTAPTCAVR